MAYPRRRRFFFPWFAWYCTSSAAVKADFAPFWGLRRNRTLHRSLHALLRAHRRVQVGLTSQLFATQPQFPAFFASAFVRIVALTSSHVVDGNRAAAGQVPRWRAERLSAERVANHRSCGHGPREGADPAAAGSGADAAFGRSETATWGHGHGLGDGAVATAHAHRERQGGHARGQAGGADDAGPLGPRDHL
eukprot:scaffold1228_cov246-Pinguiococcus_pyrenoidosus.AAC.19